MNAHKGFTLIELLIVVAIVAILAAVAYPSYEAYMVKTRRATAAACLLELTQFMERFYTVNLKYDETIGGVRVALPDTQCRSDLTDYYDFGFVDGTVAARTYTLRAEPQGRQAENDKCQTLTINQAGQKNLVGHDPNATTVAQCWK